VSHANAALTPRARLRLARLIVEHGWPPARAAATLRRVLAHRREVGPPVPRRRPGRDGRPLVTATQPAAPHAAAGGAQDRAPAAQAKVGTGRDRRPAGPGRLHRAGGAGALPTQPAQPRGPGHRGAGAPLRTPASRGICCTSTSRNWAPCPTVGAGATSAAPRATATGRPHRASPAVSTAAHYRHRVRAYRAGRPLPGGLRRDSRRRDRRNRHRGAASRGGLVRRPRGHHPPGAVGQRLGLQVAPLG